MSNFNRLASFYDVLANLVFWGNINKANHAAAQCVSPNAKILIIGGGTGKILEYFSSKNIEIDYVELSTKMIERARKRTSKCKVNYFQKDYLLYDTDSKYDYIITPFFLDMFTTYSFQKVLLNITSQLKTKGELIIADFTPLETNIFNKFIHRVMCLFFHYISGIEINKYNYLFEKVKDSGNFEVTKETSFFSNFIQVKKCVFRK